MLAFTVQFSRYGRKPSPARRIRARQAQARMSQRHAKRLLPQDPTACPEPSPSASPRSAAPRRGSVLTGRPQESEPNNQCSTRKHGRPATHAVTRGAGAP
jgi:hypothetical protein